MIKTLAESPALMPVLQTVKKYRLPLALAVLVIFHAVGLWGMLFSGNAAYFQRLTPMNLLLTNVLLFSFHKHWNAAFFVFAIVVAAVGFFAEIIGVHTGLLFGNYSYGASLGFKLGGVPLLIGLNWLMLVYTTGHIANLTKWHWLPKVSIGALLMVLLDYFIEPVAVRYDFWTWHSDAIPVSNYLGWLVIAFLLHVYFQWAVIYKNNRLAPWVYLVQFLFFLILFSYL